MNKASALSYYSLRHFKQLFLHSPILNDSFLKKEYEDTEKFLVPYIDLIQFEIEKIREQVDFFYRPNNYIKYFLSKERKILAKEKSFIRRKSSLSKYPIGFCREITDAVVDLLKNVIKNKNHPLYFIQEFINLDEYYDIRTHWCIAKDDEYFQNIIQIGTLIIDCSNDTVLRPKEKVLVFRNLNETQYAPIDNFFDVEKISNIYWNSQLIPNLFFPKIISFFPSLLIDEDLKITFNLQFAIISLNLISNGEELKRYFSKRFDCEISQAQKEIMIRVMEKALKGESSYVKSLFEFQEIRDSSIFDSLIDFDKEFNLEELHSREKAMLRVINKFNKIMK